MLMRRRISKPEWVRVGKKSKEATSTEPQTTSERWREGGVASTGKHFRTQSESFSGAGQEFEKRIVHTADHRES